MRITKDFMKIDSQNVHLRVTTNVSFCIKFVRGLMKKIQVMKNLEHFQFFHYNQQR